MTRLETAAGSDRPAGDEPEEQGPGPGDRAPASVRAPSPAHVALLIVFAAALTIAVSPVNDIDSYWHVVIGQEIAGRHTLSGLGRQWLDPGAPGWQTSQWLSEVLMYGAVDRFGWLALPVLRLVIASLLFAVLWLTLVRRRRPLAAFVVVLGVVVAVEVLLQDRPQTVSLVFLALLAWACERMWATGRRPHPLAVAGTCVLWAQLHGLWVLAPAAFLLVAVGALADRGRARPGQLQGALVSAGACFAGLVNPVGPVSFLLPVRFRQAAGPAIAEWAPTAFTMILTVTWGLLIAVLVVAWARTPGSISATELLWVFCWTVFGLSAIRNVGPATLFVAPVVVRALERAAGGRLGRLSRGPGRREGRVLVALAVAVTVVGVAVVATSVSRVDPLERAPALAIARRLAAAPGPLRIWNAYNASGVLIAFGGGRTGHLRLVVDGRADLWGGAYIDRVGGVAELHDGWRAEFFGFRPDAAVLPVDAPLVDQLVHGDDWQVALHVPGDDYVLVVPPRSRLA